MHPLHSTRRRIGAAVVAVAAVVSLAGCGSSSDAAGSSGPIKLFQIVPTDSPVTSLPEMEAGAKAAVAAINASGGVNGRKLELTTCNDKYDANTAIACAQQAVQEQAVAMVGSLSAFADQTGPILAARKIPNIAPNGLVPSDYTNKLVYLSDPGVAGYAGAPQVLAKYAHASKIATLMVDNPSVGVVNGYFDRGAKVAGSTIVTRIAIPADAPDWLPYLKRAQQDGAQGIVTSLDANATLKLWAALQAGDLVSKLPVTITSTSVSQSIIDRADPASITNTYGMGEVPLQTGTGSYIKQYQDEIKKYQSGAAISSTAMRAWMSVYLFAKVAGTVKGDITPETIDKALDSSSGVDLFWMKGLKWPGAVKDMPRIGYPMVGAVKMQNGKQTELGQFNPFGAAS